MRERLIELIRGARKTTKGANCDLEREGLFADYLLANGVIVPPCKVGDTVYAIYLDYPTEKRIYEAIVDEIYLSQKPSLSAGYIVIRDWRFNSRKALLFEHFGKTVFLTREEAEQALRGGEKE